MEPAQIQRLESKGFRKGYLHVVRVLVLARGAETHLNPNVRRMLNEALSAMIEALNDELEPTIKELYAKPDKAPE